MAVERSDFEIALEEGTIRCAAKVGGRSLVGRGAFVDERLALQVARSEEREGNAWRGAVRSRSRAVPPRADSRFEGGETVGGARTPRAPALQQRAMPGRI